jgi:exopolyphosphatase/pppGpp-phosphohydrolase
MERQNKAATYAAIDIGSNSTEMAIANCTPDHLEMIQDASTMLRVGESVKATGEVSQETQGQLLTTLRQYQDQAKQHGADPILAVATEAMREAHNSQAVLDTIEHETGLHLSIIPGTIEAALTYHGATYGSDIPPDTGVLDVGGGSTELITARQRHITWLTSLPIGSGWLHDQYLTADPPMGDEIEEAQDFLHQYLQNLHVPHLPLTLVVTGSSAKKLLQLAKQILKLDPDSDRLTRKDLSGCLGVLSNLPAQEVAQRYGLEIERARILPGGALIMLEAMAYLRLNEVHVSHYGVREGVLLAYARYGEHWLDHEDVNVDESRIATAPPLPKKVAQNDLSNQTFAQSGQNELAKRVQKFLSWQGDVLKNEDVEAVHKMRVASRRLRATMDAYEAASKQKPFQQSYKCVKKAADLLGAARDTDVMLQDVDKELEHAPLEEKAGLQWFHDRLSTYRKQEQQNLEAFLQNFDNKAFKQQIASCITTKKGNSNG